MKSMHRLLVAALACLPLYAMAQPAPKVFVCNVATQDGETSGFDLAAHAEALVAHTGPDITDIVLADNHVPTGQGSAVPAKAVRLRWPPAFTNTSGSESTASIDIVDRDDPHHHDPARLAAALIKALERETGIRRRTASRSA